MQPAQSFGPRRFPQLDPVAVGVDEPAEAAEIMLLAVLQHFCAAGGAYANTGEIQSIVVHEWGHGYDENDGGGFDNTDARNRDVRAR